MLRASTKASSVLSYGMHVQQPVEEHAHAQRDDREAAEQERERVAAQDVGTALVVVRDVRLRAVVGLLRVGLLGGSVVRAGFTRRRVVRGGRIGGRSGRSEIEDIAIGRAAPAAGRTRVRRVLEGLPLIVKHGKLSPPDGPATCR